MASTVPNKFRNISVSNAAVLVAAGNLVVLGWNLIAGGTANVFLKLYNAATAGAVSVGTTTPVTTVLIPGSGTFWQSNEDKFQNAFSLGIVCAVTANLTDTDNTAPGSNAYVELSYNTNF